MTRLQIIGGGRMGGALLAGLAAGDHAGADLAVVEVDADARDRLAERHPGVVVAAGPLAGVDAVIAVKPHLVVPVCRQLAAGQAPQRVLSIAAGIPTTAMEAVLPPSTRVVRAMPNTPALVGAGVAAVAAGATAGDDDVAWATALLEVVGAVVAVPEDQLDAVTGVSGSGPAYVLLFLEALIDAAVTAGLPRASAEVLARHTLLGTAKLALDTGDPPSELRAGVTTPGGTTAAGVRVLEQRAVRAAVIDAVAAAADRSRQLAAPPDR